MVPRADIELPTSVERLVNEARSLRLQLRELSERANSATAVAAQQLVRVVGLTLQQTGDLLGISPQRVHQLVSPARRPRCGVSRVNPTDPHRGQTCIRVAGHPGWHRYRDDSLLTPEVTD